MDLLLNGTTNHISKSTYNIEISNNKYLSYSRLRQVCSSCLGVQLSSILIVYLQPTELYLQTTELYWCIAQVHRYVLMILILCLCYTNDKNKTIKKGTIKVPHVLEFIVLPCLVLIPIHLIQLSLRSRYQYCMYS